MITIPLHWKISTNEIYAGKHWTKRSDHKKNYRDAYIQTLKKLGEFKEQVDISFYFKFKSRALDSSNCGYMAKLLEDCLVKARVIENDSPKYVGWVSMKSSKGTKDEVEISVCKST